MLYASNETALPLTRTVAEVGVVTVEANAPIVIKEDNSTNTSRILRNFLITSPPR